MQPLEELDSSPSSTLQRWHPKLTPYRLLVLGTTIGVGTAKAVAAQEGDSSASTTLEWVSGVVIFLILYSMSTYDELPKDPPPFLGWLFSVDCMDYIWHFLSFLRIPRPWYSSELDPTPRPNTRGRGHTRSTMPITLYRLFVSFITAFFGLTKATITYIGFSVGATWVDWALGALVTSILFVLGMYEHNTIGMWHGFFVPDHSIETLYGLSVVSVTAVFLFWIAMCFWMAYLILTNDYSAFLSTEDKYVPLADLPPVAALRENLFTACLILFLALVLATSVFAGVANIAAIMSSSQLPKWRSVADAMMRQRPASSKGYTPLEPSGRRLARRITYHTVILTTFLLGCAVFLAFWVVSIAANVEEGYHGNLDFHLPAGAHSSAGASTQAAHGRGYLVFISATILFQLCGAGATAFFMWVVAWKALLPPLWAYRNAEVNWDRALLF